jgi:hypothetical protein
VWVQYDARGGKTLAHLLQRVKCRRENKILNQERVENMSIEKKSLISTLKSTKKANLANEISHDQMTRTAGTKASPVAKLSAKASPVAKLSAKASPVTKLSAKASPVTKLSAKASPVKKLAIKN